MSKCSKEKRFPTKLSKRTQYHVWKLKIIYNTYYTIFQNSRENHNNVIKLTRFSPSTIYFTILSTKRIGRYVIYCKKVRSENEITSYIYLRKKSLGEKVIVVLVCCVVFCVAIRRLSLEKVTCWWKEVNW